MELNSLEWVVRSDLAELEIADADGSIILQVESGAAGGHHSFDRLEELLPSEIPDREENCVPLWAVAFKRCTCCRILSAVVKSIRRSSHAGGCGLFGNGSDGL